MVTYFVTSNYCAWGAKQRYALYNNFYAASAASFIIRLRKLWIPLRNHIWHGNSCTNLFYFHLSSISRFSITILS